MAQRSFPVLVATDGSPAGPRRGRDRDRLPVAPRQHAATASSRGHTPVLTDAAPAVWEALLEVSRAEARRAEQRLRRRWPDADVFVTDAPPVPGILARARRLRARAIVLGSRGLGAVGRFLLGSVSRAVRAAGAVLRARGARLGAGAAPLPDRRRRLPPTRGLPWRSSPGSRCRAAARRASSAWWSPSGRPPPGSCPLACAPWWRSEAASLEREHVAARPAAARSGAGAPRARGVAREDRGPDGPRRSRSCFARRRTPTCWSSARGAWAPSSGSSSAASPRAP